MWRKLQIGLILLAFLLLFVDDKLSIPLLFYAGMASFGMLSMAIGWEGIITREIVVGRRRHGNRVTYTGVAAIFQGIQFNLIGLFLMAVAITTYMRTNIREIFLQTVRRPGMILVIFGILVLMQAVITTTGSLEQQERSRKDVIFTLLLARLLPGVALLVAGFALMGLGMLEIAAPNMFDAMGGGFLEMLYGLR